MLQENVEALRSIALKILKSGQVLKSADLETLAAHIQSQEKQSRDILETIRKCAVDMEASAASAEDSIKSVATKGVSRDSAHTFRCETEWRTNSYKNALTTQSVFRTSMKEIFPESRYKIAQNAKLPQLKDMCSCIQNIVSFYESYDDLGNPHKVSILWSCGLVSELEWDQYSSKFVGVKVKSESGVEDLSLCRNLERKAHQVYFAEALESGETMGLHSVVRWLSQVTKSLGTRNSLVSNDDRSVLTLDIIV